jgi:hypothetical protein
MPARRLPAHSLRHEGSEMKTFQDGAYAMAALSAAVVAFRILVKKGLLTRDEAVRSLLDEAVQRAIFAESLKEGATQRSTAELNRQSAEILKFIAESL